MVFYLQLLLVLDFFSSSSLHALFLSRKTTIPPSIFHYKFFFFFFLVISNTYRHYNWSVVRVISKTRTLNPYNGSYKYKYFFILFPRHHMIMYMTLHARLSYIYIILDVGSYICFFPENSIKLLSLVNDRSCT